MQPLLLCDREGGEQPDNSKLVAAASILEAGVRYSPHNPHIKISALFVYAQLNAASLSWKLFRQLFVKHIQHESLAYLILPILRSGGMYQETIAICKEIVRLQRVAIQEAGEFSARAMEHGALSKADEFLNFHRKRMNNSLTTFEAKGLILDAAPLFVHDGESKNREGDLLGSVHGIVGGSPSDIDRANQIIGEVHDPFAAFSLLRLHGGGSQRTDADSIAKFLSDNRDFSVVLSHDILLQRKFDSSEVIVQDSLRRGHVHAILLRGVLCVEMTKGPKKGKVAPPSETLKKRCASLLASIDGARADFSGSSITGYSRLLQVVLDECRALVVVSSGLTNSGSSANKDSLETREQIASALLGDASEGLKAAQIELSQSFGCPRTGVHRVSRLLPECIVPAYAVFQMCAEVLDLYGWGRRKRKTKRCAAALADVAIAFTSLLDDMVACLGKW